MRSREGKIRAAGREIATIVEDWRSRAAGGLDTAILLWEACCIPSLLAGCGAWVEMSKATEKKLNHLQNWFLRLILRVGPGAPLESLLWDTAMLDMGLLVWREKLMLAHHVRSLGEETLARRFYEEQRANNWPGLAREAEDICLKLELENVNTTDLDSKNYRKLVTKALHKENEKRLRKGSEAKEKCIKMRTENYGKQNYLKDKNIGASRNHYKARYRMTNFAGNFSKDKRFAKSNWLCECKRSSETEVHILEGKCEAYSKIREKYGDLTTDEDLVSYFSEILEERERLQEEGRGVPVVGETTPRRMLAAACSCPPVWGPSGPAD